MRQDSEEKSRAEPRVVRTWMCECKRNGASCVGHEPTRLCPMMIEGRGPVLVGRQDPQDGARRSALAGQAEQRQGKLHTEEPGLVNGQSSGYFFQIFVTELLRSDRSSHSGE